MSISRRIAVIFLAYLLVCLGAGSILVLSARQAVTAVTDQDFQQAKTALIRAHRSWRVLDWLTLGLLPHRAVATTCLAAAPSGIQAIEDTKLLTQGSQFSAYSATQWLSQLLECAQTIKETNTLTAIFEPEEAARYDQLLTFFIDHAPLAREALFSTLDGKHTWLIVLQNSQELRATGGFMGSYILVEWDTGQLVNISTEDIYDADGQLSQGVVAPAGVSEYLTGGYGLRIPDSNWFADAQQSSLMLSTLLQKAGKSQVDITVFTTTTAFEQLLKHIEPVPLAEYPPLTSENLTQVLSSHHADFFPGSHEKKQLIDAAQTAVRLRVSQASKAELISLLLELKKQLLSKNILVSSQLPQLSSQLIKHQLAGTLPLTSPGMFSFISVESNVGINKVNQSIKRTATIQLNQSQLEATVVLSNSSVVPDPASFPATHVGSKHAQYINYHRFLLPTRTTGIVLTVDGKQLNFVQTLVTDSQGQEYLEVGALITVPEQSQAVIKLQAQLPSPPSSLFIYKQPGLLPYPVHIATPDSQETVELHADMLRSL